MGYQKTTIIGHLGRDPEMKTAATGTAYCKFSVAVSEKYNGNESTEWFNCTAFGKTAEACAQYLQKGSQVYIEGKVSARAWQPKDGGDPRAALELIIHTVQFLSSKPKQDTQSKLDPVVREFNEKRRSSGELMTPEQELKRAQDSANIVEANIVDPDLYDGDIPF